MLLPRALLGPSIACGLLGAIAMAVVGQDARAVDLFVDFGVADDGGVVSTMPNQVQAGFSAFDVTPVFNGNASGDFYFNLTESRNISGLTVALLGGGNGLYFQDQANDVSGPLGDLIEESISVIGDDITITVSGLPAGQYVWTGYHHHAEPDPNFPPASFDIYFNGGAGEMLAVADVDISTGFDPASVTTSTYGFTKLDAGDVTFRLDGTFTPPGISTPVYINGFSIVEVPEPGSAVLLAIGLLGIAVKRRRLAAA